VIYLNGKAIIAPAQMLGEKALEQHRARPSSALPCRSCSITDLHLSSAPVLHFESGFIQISC